MGNPGLLPPLGPSAQEEWGAAPISKSATAADRDHKSVIWSNPQPARNPSMTPKPTEGSGAGSGSLTIEQDDSVLIVAAGSELDIATAPALRDELSAAVARGVTRLVIDLTDVTFIDSVALAVLVNTSRKLSRRGRLAVVVQPGSYGMLIFEASGIDALLPIFDTRPEAVAFARA
jgi:anti-sigma B factor antagonist